MATRTWHGVAFAELFTQSLALYGKAGLVSLGRVALDGTKVPAAAKGALEAEYGAKARAKAEQQAATRGDDPAQVTAAGNAAEASAMAPDNASWTPPMAISKSRQDSGGPGS